MKTLTPTIQDVERASRFLKGLVAHTPCHPSPYFSERVGAEVSFKLECYQPIRVFKIRGATYRMMHLTQEEKDAGVITASAGNHGLGVAYAAKVFGIKSTICVPRDANPVKTSAIESLGAEVLRKGEIYDDAYANSLEVQKERGLTYIHPFDDPYVIAGQGTAGLEILEDQPGIDTVFVPIGGGGLVSGIALALKSVKPGIRIIGVQPEGSPTMYESVRQGRRVRLDKVASFADGLLARESGDLTLAMVKRYVDDILLVTDEEMALALVSLLRNERVLAEPSGAASLAALMYRYTPMRGERIACVISGGNISPTLLKDLLVKYEGREI